MTTRTCLILFALVAPLPVLAAEKYTLKIEKPEQVGDRIKATTNADTENVMVLRDGTGNVVRDHKETNVASATFVETIVAKEQGKRASKLLRKYESATQTKDGKKRELDLAGKTVIVER